MKDIKDYIYKKDHYIHCKSQEEWDKISKLLGRTSTVGYKTANNNDCLTTNNPNSSWSLEYVIKYDYTLLEASDFLKQETSEKQLTVDDLKYGEVYVTEYRNQGEYIFKHTGNLTRCPSINPDRKLYFEDTDKSPGNGFKYYRLATKEEIYWLDYCIASDKFISKEEALKSFEQSLENKFEVGRWYKNPNPSYNKSFAKFTKWENDKFCFSEWIDKEVYKNTSSWWNFRQENKVYPPLEDLSEIQQYLPKDHPDKFPESKTMSKEELLEEAKKRYPVGCKFKSPIGRNLCEITSSEATFNYSSDGDFIWINLGHKGSGNRLYEKGKWAEIISLPETNQINNEVMNEKYYPKKGEWVIRITEGDNYANFVTINKKYQVLEDTSDNIVKLVDDNGNRGVFTLSNFRKAEPHEIPTTSNNSNNLSSLPEKWFITVTKENKDLAAKWRFLDEKTQIPSYFKEGAIVGYSTNSNSKGWDDKWNSYWINELTFDQFKQWVLNESPKQSHSDQMIDIMNDEVPEYITVKKGGWNSSVSSNSYELGIVYKVIKFDPNISLNLGGTYYCEGDHAFYKDYCIKSTKEAYLQQQSIKLQQGEIKISDYIEAYKPTTKEVDKWTVGGWVKLLRDPGYGKIPKVGNIYQIIEWVRQPDIIRINCGECHPLCYINTEVEWLGMEKPNELHDRLDFTVNVHQMTNLDKYPITIKEANKSKKATIKVDHQKPIIIGKTKTKSKLIVI